MNTKRRLLYYSRYAFYKAPYSVFEQLCADFYLEGFVIAHERPPVPRVYAPDGHLTHESAGFTDVPDFATVIPGGLPPADQSALLKKKVEEIDPDFIWAHEEPNVFLVNQMLQWFRHQRKPRIVVHAVENIWPCPGGYRARWAHFRRQRLWQRYNGVLAASSKSIEAVRQFGMPPSVPVQVAWLPHLLPPPAANNGDAPFLPRKKDGEIFIGFAGRIAAAKGWRVLVAALTLLPESYKCLIAGAGDEEAELRLWCLVPELRKRLRYVGLLPKDRLWSLYRASDIFVLPSLTTPNWTEQFGCVLAEAMSCGVPVIGSSSGAIPEVIGDCGMVVEENSPVALAQAIETLARDPKLRADYAEKGRRRFEQEYSYKAYAARVAAALELTK